MHVHTYINTALLIGLYRYIAKLGKALLYSQNF